MGKPFFTPFLLEYTRSTVDHPYLINELRKPKPKNKLLVVLKHPYIPLHNNESELAARKEVQYRDISFQTRNQRGTLANDVFFTIIQTCKKMGINPYAYILDEITRKQQMIPLPQLMR